MPTQLQQLAKRHETTGTTSFPALPPAPDVVNCREMSGSQGKCDGTKPPNLVSKPLSPRQRATVQMLVAGKTADAVAQELGINPRTVFRWKKLPGFNDAIDRCLLELRTRTSSAAANRIPARRMRFKPLPKPTPMDLDGDDEAEEEFNPTEKEKQNLEKLFASFGYTPTWKRGIVACREMSGSVAKCQGEEQKVVERTHEGSGSVDGLIDPNSRRDVAK